MHPLFRNGDLRKVPHLKLYRYLSCARSSYTSSSKCFFYLSITLEAHVHTWPSQSLISPSCCASFPSLSICLPDLHSSFSPSLLPQRSLIQPQSLLIDFTPRQHVSYSSCLHDYTRSSFPVISKYLLIRQSLSSFYSKNPTKCSSF